MAAVWTQGYAVLNAESDCYGGVRLTPDFSSIQHLHQRVVILIILNSLGSGSLVLLTLHRLAASAQFLYVLETDGVATVQGFGLAVCPVVVLPADRTLERVHIAIESGEPLPGKEDSEDNSLL